ncbi:MAG TPA: DUF3313 domain-containing protein [Steroidobacteraceae bacterium]
MHTLLTSSSQKALVLGIALAAAGCTSTKPIAYSGIASSAQLQLSANDVSGRVPFEYWAPVNWRSYSTFILEPVSIYRGADNQFEKVSEEDKTSLAQYMQTRFTEKLSARFKSVATPSSNTLRIKVTLTGAKDSKPVVSTFTRFDLLGGSYNAVQAARGKEGAFTGSVSYAVEIYDASTNQLLGAYVTKQYPNPYNLKATLGKRKASIAGIEKGADQLLSYLS